MATVSLGVVRNHHHQHHPQPPDDGQTHHHHHHHHPAQLLPLIAPAIHRPGTGATAAPPLSPASLDARQAHLRQWHNRIGKKYRNKLNEQYERLQGLLRLEELGDDKERRDGRTGVRADRRSTMRHGRAVNKARVLELARRRIEGLVREAEEMARERERLVGLLLERKGERARVVGVPVEVDG